MELRVRLVHLLLLSQIVGLVAKADDQVGVGVVALVPGGEVEGVDDVDPHQALGLLKEKPLEGLIGLEIGQLMRDVQMRHAQLLELELQAVATLQGVKHVHLQLEGLAQLGLGKSVKLGFKLIQEVTFPLRVLFLIFFGLHCHDALELADHLFG